MRDKRVNKYVYVRILCLLRVELWSAGKPGGNLIRIVYKLAKKLLGKSRTALSSFQFASQFRDLRGRKC